MLLMVAGLLTFLFSLGIIGAYTLHPTRGLDITDEGLYILATNPDVNWVYPFGWSTSWLFSVSRHNLATFRLLGFVVLECSSILLSATTYLYSRTLSGSSKRFFSLEFGSFLAIGFLAPFFYYGGYHRTPSYKMLGGFNS